VVVGAIAEALTDRKLFKKLVSPLFAFGEGASTKESICGCNTH